MSSFSVGQMNQLGDAMEVANLTPKHVTRLGQSSVLLENLRRVLDGAAIIKMVDHILDLSVPCNLPFDSAERISPEKSGIVKLEREGDELCLDGRKINLFLSEKQKSGIIGGHELRKELEALGGNVSAKVLDHLVDHPQMWPESWKKDFKGNTLYVYFWDDVFRSPSHRRLYVRYGYWGGGRVVSDYYWLDFDSHVNHPAASVAS